MTLSAPTISCGGFVYRIEGALGAIPGVQEATVDFGSRTVRLRYNTEQVSCKQLNAALASAGYPVASAGTAQHERDSGTPAQRTTADRRRLPLALGTQRQGPEQTHETSGRRDRRQ